MVSSQSNWESFFREAGIPRKIAENYATIFYDNRMRLDMLSALDKDVLRDLGIKAVGDSIAILRYARSKQTEMSRYHSPSPEVAIKTKLVPKKKDASLVANSTTSIPNVSSSSLVSSVSSANQRSNDVVDVKERVSSKQESSSKVSSITKSKTSRKTLSDRFSEYESSTKKKKEEEEENEKKRLEEAATLKQKTKGTVFTIQLPSKITSKYPKESKKVTENRVTESKKVTESAQKIVTLIPAQGKTLDRKKQSTSIFDRLEKPPILVQAQQPTTNKSAVFNRLGSTNNDFSTSASVEASSSRVLKKSLTVAPTKLIHSVESGSVFDRLGKR
ncbi:uncharacterized protein C19orf47 homolog isoform X1 [Hydra vulgaris]|uniref:Uncharacterized protein C19orf47 n=1 Tax=Hydra vulgaris TaxID=6087 RepID=T2M9U6_HYDVU|nr:uncharacterized protein C19orf47 homolog [Hydra vulgaris]